MIELYLSSDGKHTVHVSAETPEELVGACAQCQSALRQDRRGYGNKAQMWQEAGIVKAHTKHLAG